MAAIAVGLVLVAGACSNDGSDEATDPSTTTAATGSTDTTATDATDATDDDAFDPTTRECDQGATVDPVPVAPVDSPNPRGSQVRTL